MYINWIKRNTVLHGLTWNRGAYGERVPAVTGHTTADGAVINDHAIGIESTGARAGIHAFVVLAR